MRTLNVDYNPLRRSTSARYDADHMGLRREQIGLQRQSLDLQREALRWNTIFAGINAGLNLVNAGCNLATAIDGLAKQSEIKFENKVDRHISTQIKAGIDDNSIRAFQTDTGEYKLYHKDDAGGWVEGLPPILQEALDSYRKQAREEMGGLRIGNAGRMEKRLADMEEGYINYAIGATYAKTVQDNQNFFLDNLNSNTQAMVDSASGNMRWNEESKNWEIIKPYESTETTDSWNTRIEELEAEISGLEEILRSGEGELTEGERELYNRYNEAKNELEQTKAAPEYKQSAVPPELLAERQRIREAGSGVFTPEVLEQTLRKADEMYEQQLQISLAGRTGRELGTAEGGEWVQNHVPVHLREQAWKAMYAESDKFVKEIGAKALEIARLDIPIDDRVRMLEELRASTKNPDAAEAVREARQGAVDSWFYDFVTDIDELNPQAVAEGKQRWERISGGYYDDDGGQRERHERWFDQRLERARGSGGGGGGGASGRDTSEDDMWAFVRRYEDGIDPIEITMQNLEQYREHKPRLYGELRDRLLTQHNMGAAPAMINFLNTLDLYKGQKPKDNATQAEKDAYLQRQNEIEILKANALREYQALKRGEDMDKILNEGSRRYIGIYVDEMISTGKMMTDNFWTFGTNEKDQGMFEMMYMGHSGALNLIYGAKIDDPLNPYKETEQIAGGENAKNALIANAEYGQEWMSNQFEKYDIKINGQVLKASLTENSYQKDIIGYERDEKGNIKTDNYGKPIPIYGEGLTGEVHYFDQFGNRYRINSDQQTDRNGKATNYVNERVERFVNGKWEKYNTRTNRWE